MELQERGDDLLHETARQGRHDPDNQASLGMPMDGVNRILDLLDAAENAVAFVIKPHSQFRRSQPAFDALSPSLSFVAGIGALATALFALFGSPVINAAQAAASALFG